MSIFLAPKTYVRAPGTVQAVRVPSESSLEYIQKLSTVSIIAEWCSSEVFVGEGRNYRTYLYLRVPTPGGLIKASPGDWVLKDSTGAFHIMKHRQFTEMYMEFSDPSQSPEEEEKSPWIQPTMF
jgi:hypothetical protein